MKIKIIMVQALSLSILGISLVDVLNATTLLDRIYHIFTFITLSMLSYLLVKNVMDEIRRKNELQIMSDQLTSANEKLKELDDFKDDFISMASHQLKKVPTPIKGYLSILLDGSYGNIPENQRKVLENIYSANERQIHLVDDLLNVVRMESGKVELNF